jgi:hypothetical protein
MKWPQQNDCAPVTASMPEQPNRPTAAEASPAVSLDQPEAIALFRETVELLTAIHNNQLEMINLLGVIYSQMP